MSIQKHTMKLVATAFLAITLLATVWLMPIEAASNQQKVTIDRVNIHFIMDGQVYHAPKEQQSFIYEGRTYVPVRFASYLSEKWVDWNQQTATVVVQEPTAVQLKGLQSNKKNYLVPNADSSKPASETKKQVVTASLDVANYTFFGKAYGKPKNYTTLMIDNTIYVPVRYFGELMGTEVSYSAINKSISMTTKKPATDNGGNNGSTGNGTNTGSEGEQPGGNGEIPVVEQVSRESIVTAAYDSLSSLESTCVSQVTDIAKNYKAATTKEDQDKYFDQGYALLFDCDSKVDSILTKLDNDLKKNGYEVGEDSANFRKEYTTKKQTLLAQLM